MNIRTLTAVLTVASATAMVGLAAAQRHQEPPPGAHPGHQAGGQDMGMMMIEALKSTPGCLGVDAGEFMSGKKAIMAWFQDKQAAAGWYYSPMHQQMMKMGFGQDATERNHEPLAHVEDGVPVMVVASITFADKPEIEGIPMPISQIAIELYTPLPGGAFINGRFAPDTLKVPHMKGEPATD